MTETKTSRAIWALAPVLTLGPILTCGIPRVMAPLFLISAYAAIIADSWQYKVKPSPDRLLALLFGALIAFGSISYLWTINPDDTFSKVGELVGIFGATVFLMPVIQRMNRDDLALGGRFLGIGLVVGLAMYLSESFNDFPFYDGLRGGHSVEVPDIKQNKAAVLLAVWLYLAFPFFVSRGETKKLFFYGMCLLGVGYITSYSPSTSAQVVLLAAPFLAGILRVLPTRFGILLTFIVSVFLTLAMPFISITAKQNIDLRTSSLSDSIKSRIEIWDQASRRMLEKPIFGWGLDASPNLPNRNESSYYSTSDFPLRPIHHLHPHNGPIQIWFELGAVGVAMLIGLFWIFYKRLQMQSGPLAAKYGAFMWAIIFLYTLSIWGIWQSWFTSTLSFAGLMTYAGMRYLTLNTTHPADLA